MVYSVTVHTLVCKSVYRILQFQLFPILLDFVISHYANMSVQYTVIFHGCKNDNFQMKKCNVFHIFAQNIDCGYMLEPPHRVPTIYVLQQI